MEIYRELYQISKDLREFTNKARMLQDTLKGDKPIKLQPGEVAKIDQPESLDKSLEVILELFRDADNFEEAKRKLKKLLKEKHLENSIKSISAETE